MSIELDSDKKKYAKNNEELNQTLEDKYTLPDSTKLHCTLQRKVPNKRYSTIEKQLLEKAKSKTKKELDRQFKRLIEKKDDDYFTTYLDSITRAFGPHTSYLPPEQKEDFDINMSGQLEGIGAILREDDGFIKVVRIIPEASWREGNLKAEDIILKVS